ncbi:unnamed protein product [Absidia cylindrospora]
MEAPKGTSIHSSDGRTSSHFEKEEHTTTEYYNGNHDVESIEKKDREHHLDTTTALTDADVVEYNYDTQRADELDEDDKPSRFALFYQKYRKFFLIAMWLIFTGFVSAAYALQVPKGYNQENLILGLIYAWHSLYVFFCFAPTTVVTKPWMFAVRTVYAPISGFSSRTRTIMYASFVLAVIMVTVFALPETEHSKRVQRLIAFVGMILFIVFTFASSTNHRAVNWNTIRPLVMTSSIGLVTLQKVILENPVKGRLFCRCCCGLAILRSIENVLLIKPFLPHLTDAELHQVMTSGFATISGSVLYGYFAMGVDGTALISSCVMSIPCSIAISKIRYPETENPITKGTVRLPKSEERLEGIVHAAGVGAATGVQIVLLIGANLIALLALLYAVNSGLTWIGNFITIQNLTLQLVTGYILVPVAWLIGADNKDLVTVGQLIATKIWANEFVAYQDMMAIIKEGGLSERSISVTTYALCGFSNLSSIGMQVGVLTALAPKKAQRIATVAVSAMICGAISTFVSASIAGMLF